jgi:hypothetical protein
LCNLSKRKSKRRESDYQISVLITLLILLFLLVARASGKKCHMSQIEVLWACMMMHLIDSRRHAAPNKLQTSVIYYSCPVHLAAAAGRASEGPRRCVSAPPAQRRNARAVAPLPPTTAGACALLLRADIAACSVSPTISSTRALQKQHKSSLCPITSLIPSIVS